MAQLAFEWDDRKDTANQRKHGVSFTAAQTVFSDDDALVIPDPAHSGDEDRFILLGVSSALRALVVCNCYREGLAIRIISARRANGEERRQYEHRGK